MVYQNANLFSKNKIHHLFKFIGFEGEPYTMFDLNPEGFQCLCSSFFALKMWSTHHYMHHNFSLLDLVRTFSYITFQTTTVCALCIFFNAFHKVMKSKDDSTSVPAVSDETPSDKSGFFFYPFVN